MTNSLRVRLLWWLLVPLALYVSVTAKSVHDTALHTADLVQDNQLLSSARMIAGEVEWADGRLRVDIPPAALEVFVSPYADQVFYSVRVEDGRLLAGSPEFPLAGDAAPTANEPLHYDARFGTQPIRAVAFVRQMYDNGETRRVLISVGKTERARDALVQQLWRPQLTRQIEMVVLAVLLACIGLTFELRPLMKLREDVADRDPMQLEPIRAERLHSELRPIVDAINQCIARLGVQVAAQRRFIADAAHQLRTPLTLLGTQLQFARSQRGLAAPLDEALAAMHRSNRSMVGLTNKLLLLAQAEAADVAQMARDPVDLTAIARDVVEDQGLFAQTREIDLGAELGAPAWVSGHAGLLAALVANLTENAIRYTQRGGHVTVSVTHDDDVVQLSVTDNGPGIPAEAKGRVFEPFYRVSADTDGTGLGLAIVREVVEAHRGEIVLSQSQPVVDAHAPFSEATSGGPGLTAVVTLAAVSMAASASATEA